MIKILTIVVLVVLALSVVVSIPKNSVFTEQSMSVSETPNEVTDFTARFEIYTNETKRIFTAVMYHKLSSDAFIDSPDPSIIYVKKSGVTWDDFFKTLPFTVTKDCLVTGTKETYCSNDSKKLKFILNEIETPNTLELVIKPNDSLQIRYQ